MENQNFVAENTVAHICCIRYISERKGVFGFVNLLAKELVQIIPYN